MPEAGFSGLSKSAAPSREREKLSSKRFFENRKRAEDVRDYLRGAASGGRGLLGTKMREKLRLHCL